MNFELEAYEGELRKLREDNEKLLSELSNLNEIIYDYGLKEESIVILMAFEKLDQTLKEIKGEQKC